MIHILGIDCAVQDKKIGLAFGVLDEGRLEVRFARHGGTGAVQQLKEWIDPQVPTLLAIDAPLGWPDALGKVLINHQAGHPIPEQAHLLFRRLTDREIKRRLGRQPLDVGADRIARTAHRALNLLGALAGELGLREIPLAWSPSLSEGVWAIEVYPAATLTACGIPIRGYKDLQNGANERRIIVSRLREHLFLPEDLDAALISCVDVLDAVVCLLAGADFLLGRATPPQGEETPLARKEGWIWCRERGSG